MSNKQETILDVEGMSCGSCVRHVEGALRGLEGIEKIEVRFREGKVKVEHDPSLATIEQLIEALDDAGYPAHTQGGA